MSQNASAREIAEQIVSAADNLSYLAEAIGKTNLPEAWRFGPSLELRVRLRTRLSQLDDAELSKRIDALGIAGPIRLERLAAVAERGRLSRDDLATGRPWLPRGVGLWQLNDATPLGVKVYASSRPPVDLLLAVPPRFLGAFSGTDGFAHWGQISRNPRNLDGFVRLSTLILDSVRRAQSVAQIEAAHLQDQSWCDTLRSDDRGLLLPDVVCKAAGLHASVARSEWSSVPLD